ncbi:hypothetical protein BKA67DRAFT_532261 [Truncatella angustata]|uniref:Uncharacterized protein n=1 Tax=Truncatella angustata TaxID=152316 RepID=A0A9P8URB1_9PEZI|nr:uncharacterized protein BKA67DRAFT_532261 [Truncatella angustata]KAH6657027.1 hypothetical protein BKA67DRAFT_532261 [Truncatella angustata]
MIFATALSRPGRLCQPNSSSPTNVECHEALVGVISNPGGYHTNLTGASAGERRGVFNLPCRLPLGRGPGQADPLEFFFANKDMLDIYQGVISRFGSSDQMAATGTITCEGKKVQWWID